MASEDPCNDPAGRNSAQFATTHWSTVLATGDIASPGSREALERLCVTYWYPLYAFARRQGHDAEGAQDLTQGFFAHLRGHDFFARACWQQRLAAEGAPSPPVRISEVPFDRRLVPPRDPSATPAQVDLTGHDTGLLSDPLYPPFVTNLQDNDLSSLQIGLTQLDRITFDLRAVIRLRATHPGGLPSRLVWNQYPTRVQGIEIGRVFSQLPVLHGAAGGWRHTTDGARQPVPDGTPIAQFTYHYADGSQRTHKVLYGRDVREWWKGAGDKAETERGGVVWRGTNAIAEFDGAHLRLYRTTWANPQPHHVVTHLDYESPRTACSPFLVAVTGE